jgi:hypothetical protein
MSTVQGQKIFTTEDTEGLQKKLHFTTRDTEGHRGREDLCGVTSWDIVRML